VSPLWREPNLAQHHKVTAQIPFLDQGVAQSPSGETLPEPFSGSYSLLSRSSSLITQSAHNVKQKLAANPSNIEVLGERGAILDEAEAGLGLAAHQAVDGVG
jgi:hypothetical protein